MQIDLFTFGAQVVNFLVLVLLLRRFLYRPVVRAMDRREEGIAAQIEEARRKLVEAEEKEKEYRHKLDELERTREEMLAEAREEVEQSRKKWLHEAREEVDALQKRWRESLAQERESFRLRLRKETGERVADLLRGILQDLSTRTLEEQLAERFLERLAKVDAEDRILLEQYAREGGREVSVASSFDTDETLRRRIRQALDGCFGREMEYRFEVDPALGAGLEVQAGGWRLGWSVESRLRSLEERMEEWYEGRQTEVDRRPEEAEEGGAS